VAESPIDATHAGGRLCLAAFGLQLAACKLPTPAASCFGAMSTPRHGCTSSACTLALLPVAPAPAPSHPNSSKPPAGFPWSRTAASPVAPPNRPTAGPHVTIYPVCRYVDTFTGCCHVVPLLLNSCPPPQTGNILGNPPTSPPAPTTPATPATAVVARRRRELARRPAARHGDYLQEHAAPRPAPPR